MSSRKHSLVSHLLSAFCLATLLSTMACTSAKPLTSEKRTLVFPATNPQFDTDCKLEAGQTYQITARAIRDEQGRAYADKSFLLPATPEGIAVFPLGWMMLPMRDATTGCWYPLLRKLKLAPDSEMPRLRVVRDQNGKRAHFLTLIAIVSDEPPSTNLSELEATAWVIGRRAVITPKKSGRLWLFANDWPDSFNESGGPSFYGNNRGSLEVVLQRID